MDDQASMKAGRGHSGNGSVVGSVAGFGNDVASLIELQAKLAALDLNEAVRQGTLPLVIGAVGLAFLGASLPVLLIGVAYLLATALAIHLGWALLLTAGVALLASVSLVITAGSRLGRSLGTFRRSREELVRNLSWLRTVLVLSGRPAPRRRL